MILVMLEDQQFWRRMIDIYSLKNRGAEYMGAATLLSWHASLLSRRISLTEELSALLCHFIYWETTWWFPATSCVEAFMKHTASWRVERDHHRVLNSSPKSFPKETSSHSWLAIGPKQWLQKWRILHPFSHPGSLTFSLSWLFIPL